MGAGAEKLTLVAADDVAVNFGVGCLKQSHSSITVVVHLVVPNTGVVAGPVQHDADLTVVVHLLEGRRYEHRQVGGRGNTAVQ